MTSENDVLDVSGYWYHISMTHRSLRRTYTASATTAARSTPTNGPTVPEDHAAHRTQNVRLRGLLIDLPGTQGPVEVYVGDQSDWELIYRNPAVRVKCLVDSCDTLLTAKRMSRSGLRFLAVRSGGCAHNLSALQIGRAEVEQDATKLEGGGGPEGDEHLWIKGRLYKIARALGAVAVVEDSLTYADVLLPEHDLALEYQRWNSDFAYRTAQRRLAGAKRTLWLFPSNPPQGLSSVARKKITREVFGNGGIYLAVLNKDDYDESQKPWENPAQERSARLYASGSIAAYDQGRRTLVRTRRSMATVMNEIIEEERVLVEAQVWSNREVREVKSLVWVRRDDFDRALAAREELRVARIQISGSQPVRAPEAQPEGEPERTLTAELQSPSDNLPTLPPPTTESPRQPSRMDARRETIAAPASSTVFQLPPKLQRIAEEQPVSRESWWRNVMNWFRGA